MGRFFAAPRGIRAFASPSSHRSPPCRGIARRRAHHPDRDRHCALAIAHLRRILVARRRPVREDRRQGVRRGQPERPAEPRHRRHRIRPAQRARQRGIRLQLLHPQAERSFQGRAQDDVRAAEPRRQDLGGARRVTVDPAPTATTGLGDHQSDRARQFLPHAARLHHRVERVGGHRQSRQSRL